VIAPAANAADVYAAYSTGRLYDVRGHRVFAELVKAPNPGANAGIALQINGNDFAHVAVRDGNLLVATANVGGVYMQFAAIPYDAVAHRFIALEERTGQLSFEASPDGVTFTPFIDGPDPIDLSGNPGFAARRSSTGWDLRGDAITVAVPMPPTANMLGSLALELDSSNSIELQVTALQVRASIQVMGSTMVTPMARATDEIYVRSSESSGTVYFDVSTDRVTWQNRFSFAAPFAFDDLIVSLQGGIPGTTMRPPDSLQYDDLDTP
jgi:hypothetical protein